MYLFATIAIVCMLLNFSMDIAKLLHISKLIGFVGRKLFFSKSAGEPVLQQEFDQAHAELERVRNTPAASGEYAQMVKTMRAEQRIKALEDRMRTERNMSRLKGASADLVAGWTLKVLLSLVLLFITLRHRYTPVMIFTDRFNFQPLEGLMSFPTGVPNAISVPCWVVSCNVTFRLVSSLIRWKK